MDLIFDEVELEAAEMDTEGGSRGNPSSVKSCRENAGNEVRRSGSARCIVVGGGAGRFRITIPPHWGIRKALDVDGIPSALRIARGRRWADGTKSTKWSTGSFDELDAMHKLVVY